MQVLRHPDFRYLFLGQSASALGDRMVFVALALYVTEIGSPTDVGLVLAAGPLGEALGETEVLAVGAAIGTVAIASGAFARETWTLRRLERPAPSAVR